MSLSTQNVDWDVTRGYTKLYEYVCIPNNLVKSRVARNDNKNDGKIELPVEIMLFHICNLLLAKRPNDQTNETKRKTKPNTKRMLQVYNTV